MKPIIWKPGQMAKRRRRIIASELKPKVKTEALNAWLDKLIAKGKEPKVKISKRKTTPDPRQVDYDER